VTSNALTAVPSLALDRYFDALGSLLGTDERRANFAMYARGLLGDGERKSVEPIAARAAGGDVALCERYHERLGHFLRGSPWSDDDVRQHGASYALDALTQNESVDAWIIDDTGFLKQGTQSPGVQRQYTGSAGKIANCQIAVRLTVATRTAHVTVDMDLYLPEAWTEDPIRRAKAHIPDDVCFRTKHAIALDLAAKAILAGVSRGTVVADAAYGNNASFRGGLAALGLRYAVDVNATTLVHVVHDDGTFDPVARTVEQVARALPDASYRAVVWREGSKGRLQSRFARARVRVANADRDEPREQTLVIEWPKREPTPDHYVLASLADTTPLAELVRVIKQRWRTERAYQDMKGELGLDHFEGRSYPGWHHHVSVVLVCYAFLQTALRRSFPPSAECTGPSCSQCRAS
jgi:SRSO17 transposase